MFLMAIAGQKSVRACLNQNHIVYLFPSFSFHVVIPMNKSADHGVT